MGKFVLSQKNGDLFSSTTSMAHCVGGDFRMGMGIAVKFKSLFGGESELKKQNVSFLCKFIVPIITNFDLFQGQNRWLCSS